MEASKVDSLKPRKHIHLPVSPGPSQWPLGRARACAPRQRESESERELERERESARKREGGGTAATNHVSEAGPRLPDNALHMQRSHSLKAAQFKETHRILKRGLQ